MTTPGPTLVRRWSGVSPALRLVLGGLLAAGALNAVVGGSYALSGAPGVPREWLEESGLRDYFWPGLILVTVVGGSLLMAALAVLAGWRAARPMALAAGGLVLVWLAVELAVVGNFTWLQPARAIAAALIIALARLLPRRQS